MQRPLKQKVYREKSRQKSIKKLAQAACHGRWTTRGLKLILAKSSSVPNLCQRHKKIVFQMLKIARDCLPDGRYGKRVTLKAMPTPLTRMAARGFDVTQTEREAPPRRGRGLERGCQQIFAKCKLLLTLCVIRTLVKRLAQTATTRGFSCAALQLLVTIKWKPGTAWARARRKGKGKSKDTAISRFRDQRRALPGDRFNVSSAPTDI